MRKENAVVFGMGAFYAGQHQYIAHFFDVVAAVDNDTEKQGRTIYGQTVYHPKKLLELEYDCILVTTADQKFSLQIKKQLLEMGISEAKLRFSAAGGIAPYSIDPRFFANDLCHADKKQLFAENMERVIIELNSKCNRKCWFCTNAYVCDSEKNIDMSEEVFSQVVDELAEINYNQSICLSFFNEPLLSEQLEERIRTLKTRLPSSFVYLFTNGDFLTKERLSSLEEAGLDMLYIDIYINKMEYDIEEAYSKAQQVCRRLELPEYIEKCPDAGVIQGRIPYKGVPIEIRSQDFSKYAANRAESLPEHLPIPRTTHPLPCIKNFISFHIDYRGDVWPCPNYHREYEPHRQFCMGNILEKGIFELYLGKEMTAYRERNFFHRDTLPCRSCICNFNSFVESSFLHPSYKRPGESSRVCGPV